MSTYETSFQACFDEDRYLDLDIFPIINFITIPIYIHSYEEYRFMF